MSRLIVEQLQTPDVLLIRPPKFGDDRGFFSELYSQRSLAEHRIHDPFVQDNCSLSAEPGTIRGLHFQLPPEAQAKLVRVERGAIFDAFVDLRRSSPTFGQAGWTVSCGPRTGPSSLCRWGLRTGCVRLSRARSFTTRSARSTRRSSTEGFYGTTRVGNTWPVLAEKAIVSEKDRVHPGWPRSSTDCRSELESLAPASSESLKKGNNR